MTTSSGRDFSVGDLAGCVVAQERMTSLAATAPGTPMTVFAEAGVAETARVTASASRTREPAPAARPFLSIVIPVHNEADNLAPLTVEIHRALRANVEFEIVYVDDGSSDGTLECLRSLMTLFPRLRVVRHRVNSGQSAALATGVRFARGDLIVMLDGDGQNDPADIARMLARWNVEAPGVPLLLTGRRVTRRDRWSRRVSSRIANRVRKALLNDGTADTGCGLKLVERNTYLALPNFDHMHRFLPALVQRLGGRVVSVPVNHRPRLHGRTHYGVWNRLWIGLIDLAGVLWLQRRACRTEVDVITGDAESPHG